MAEVRRVIQPRDGRPLRAAFTLIELLVVISIIAIMVALLLPVLASSRETARSARCMSNLRAFPIAITAYVDESKDWWPVGTYAFCDHSPANPGLHHSALWGAVVAHYSGFRYSTEFPENATYYPNEAIFVGFGDQNKPPCILKCPSDTFTNFWGGPISVSYGYNGYVNGMGVNETFNNEYEATYPGGGWPLYCGRIRTVNIPKPARTILNADEDQPGGFEYSPYHLCDVNSSAIKVGTYHSNKSGNIVYVDGHAASKVTSKLVPADFDRYQ